jgi:hypothetical protein
MKHAHLKGSVMLLVIVFGAIFLGVLTALASYTLTLNRSADATYQEDSAAAIAEAGLAHYELTLKQSPTTTSTPNPSTFSYTDISGLAVGSYALGIVPLTSCSQAVGYQITATGTPSAAPSVAIAASVRYMPALSSQSLAQLKAAAKQANLYFSAASTTGSYGFALSSSTLLVSAIAKSGSSTPLGTYPISSGCALIYSEAPAQVSGTLPFAITIIGTTEAATTSGATLTFISTTASSSSPFSGWQEN